VAPLSGNRVGPEKDPSSKGDSRSDPGANPVIGEMVPGIPTPTGAVSPISSSINPTRAVIAAIVAQ